MNKHEELVEHAKESICRVFSDRGVSSSTTRESLEDLQSEIETYLDALASDREI